MVLMLSLATEGRMLLQWGVVIGASLVAALLDVRSRRIPNWLTVLVFGGGLVFQGVLCGVSGVLEGFGAGLLLSIPYVLLFLLAGGGGGDAKLMAGVGVWLGLRQGVAVLFSVAAAGVLVAVLYSLSQGRLRPVVRRVRMMTGQLFCGLVSLVYGHRQLSELSCLSSGEGEAATVPYGVAIFLGVVSAGVGLWLCQG